MNVSLLSSEFLNVLKKFQSSVNQEIENLERSNEDMDVLVKTVDEISSLIGSEGLSFFVEQLKNMLETARIDENNFVIIGNKAVTNSKTECVMSEALETNKVKNNYDETMDIEIRQIKKEKTAAIVKSDLAISKEEWSLKYANLLCKIMELLLPFLTVDKSSGLLFYLENLRSCSIVDTLSDTLHIFRRGNFCTEEITFKCYADIKGKKETDISNHTVITRRIYERLMNFIKLNSEQQENNIPIITWKRFIIRVNRAGDSYMEIKASCPDRDVSMIINKLNEEFNSDEAMDCNLHSLIITFRDQRNSHIVFGLPHIVERMWNMNFIIDSSDLTMWNPVAMQYLSEALYKLAKPNKQWTGMLLIDTVYSAVPVLCMADVCRNVVLVNTKNEVQQFLTSEAVRNNMLNFTFTRAKFQYILMNYFTECREVCLVVHSLNKFPYRDVTKVLNDQKISKIIFLTTLENIFCMQKLANFVEFNNVRNPFIITRVVPVDFHPLGNMVQMLFLLERTSHLVGKVIPNTKFSADMFNNFKELNVTSKGLFSDLMTETLAPQQEKPEVILKCLSAQLQYIKEISNPQPSMENTQQHVSDDNTNTPPSTIEKDENDVVANKETVQILKEDKESTNMVGSESEVMKTIAFQVCYADKAFLEDLNELQKVIMTYIIKDLDDGYKLNIDKEYQTALKFKKEQVSLEAERLSKTLITVLPQLVRTAFTGFAFEQLQMVPCPSTRTLSEKYFIVLERNSKTGKIVNTLNSNNEMIPLQHSLSYKAKNMCKLVASFILKSQYPMFNDQGQGSWCMIIRVNSKGNPWLLIEGNLDTVEEARVILSDLGPELKSFIKTGLGATKAQDLKDVFLSIYTKTSAEARVVLGDNMVPEKSGSFNIKFHGKRYPFYNPYGMMEYAKEILKLAAVNKNWGVVQVGCGCGIESLQLAKECAEFYLLRQPGTLNIYFLAKENGVRNFVYSPVNHAEEMESVIVKNMARHSNICVLYDLSEPVGFFGASVLRNNYHVKRIIYVINTSNNDWIKEVVSCCQNRTDWKEPFIVTKFASVDMAPCEDNVKMMCVLERESSMGSNLRINSSFSAEAVEELLAG